MNGDEPKVIACVGGGQLGRMMAMEAPRLHLHMKFLDAGGDACPAANLATSVVKGSLQDGEKIKELAKGADVVTVEIEHVNVDALAALEAEGVNVQPSASVLRIIRDKYQQKQHFAAANSNIALPAFCAIPSVAAISTAVENLGLPLMLKARTGAYDGRGNAVLRSADPAAVQQALQKLGVNDTISEDSLYAEAWVDFVAEIAVMVVKSSDANQVTRTYPAVNAIQLDSICRVVLAPATGENIPQEACQDLARRAIDSLGPGASGVFGVEMFVTKDGKVLLNEVAPRPHNTGHYTQDACTTNQFEQHLRAISGLPLGSTELNVGAAAMVNVLGAKSGSMVDTLASSNLALTLPQAVVHWYGKTGCKPGRKMGHINLTASSHAELQNDLEKLLKAEDIPLEVLPAPRPKALVGIIMGSQSDLPTMQAAVNILKQFNVPYEVDIVSAHRTPDKLMAYSRSAARRGLSVIIAGAGGAAHLPGMVAAMTPLPVVGVPVKTSTLSGVDSLYSIVQMPRGVPVATVAIGNAMNAGLLAVRILCTSRPDLRVKMSQYQVEMKDMVDDMSRKLLDLGSDAFLEQMEDKKQAVNV
jgi:phosphoribosylaminoimidazole carboxylase